MKQPWTPSRSVCLILSALRGSSCLGVSAPSPSFKRFVSERDRGLNLGPSARKVCVRSLEPKLAPTSVGFSGHSPPWLACPFPGQHILRVFSFHRATRSIQGLCAVCPLCAKTRVSSFKADVLLSLCSWLWWFSPIGHHGWDLSHGGWDRPSHTHTHATLLSVSLPCRVFHTLMRGTQSPIPAFPAVNSRITPASVLFLTSDGLMNTLGSLALAAHSRVAEGPCA